MLQVGAGTGLLYLLRWFWWRITAWCEVVAMISSFGVSIVLFILKKYDVVVPTGQGLMITIAITTFCWVLAAFFGPQNDRRILIEFYKKVRPFGPGWTKIRQEAGVTDEEARATHENFPLALLGWVAGCMMIWAALFSVGNYLYGRMSLAVILFIVFVISLTAVVFVMNRLWSGISTASKQSIE